MATKKTENPNPAELKASGLKATQPRLKILEIFQKEAGRHLNAEDVYRSLMEQNLEIGVATVYRVLNQFEQAGLLTRHYFEAGKAVYELNEGTRHSHIMCLRCGKIREFTDEQIKERQRIIAQEHGFRLASYALSLYGYCSPSCEG